MSETVLIVDDEDSVRRTFQEWLAGAGWDVKLLVAIDAESALQHANRQSIDLAILDWNLGSGSDGLQLLEDLSLFQPDIVAIMVTGFAHQATPLDALRMGVRDYLDKNHDLNRESFLRAVRKQLDRIIPAKRQRAFNQSLKEFRDAVEKIIPLVQTSAAMTDPVALPQAVAGLFRFVQRAVGAADGVLIVRHANAAGVEEQRALAADGSPVKSALTPFAQSIAATACSMQEPCAMGRQELAETQTLQEFERGRSNLLAIPMHVGSGIQVVMELFDKPGPGFTSADRKLAEAAADLGVELLRHALAQRQQQRTLMDAVGAALGATEKLASADHPSAPLAEPPPSEVMDRLKQGLQSGPDQSIDSDAVLQLAEAVRVLAVRHGPDAVRHCTRVVQSLRDLLDSTAGS